MEVFDASDWSEWEGCERFNSGELPELGRTEMDWTIVLSKGAVQIYCPESGEQIGGIEALTYADAIVAARGAETAWTLRDLINLGFHTYVEARGKWEGA